MAPDTPVPSTPYAFDHRGTRRAWHRARRRVATGLVAFVGVTLALAVLTSLYAEPIRSARAGVVPALFFGIVVPAGLYSYIGSLRRLNRMRKVLRSGPWRLGEGARKQPGVVDSRGVPIQLITLRGDWSKGYTARNPLRWYRWDKAMEKGVWTAGNPTFGGVIALPGGEGLMTMEQRAPSAPTPQ
ncbi:hypothetical protein [Streptomyces sp. 8N706]|uniref:hypothetical protein n=1 Tax=Streptomyces sp. 8N706 TaxID=3457416 RepID=UPI003FCFD38A